MKKIIIIGITLFICLFASARTTVIKIGQTMTVYKITDYGDSNYWGRNIGIDTEVINLPEDDYYEKLNIPKEEWECFSKSNNGIYDTELEIVKTEKEALQKDYNKLFASNTVTTDRLKILEILLAISFVGLILFAIGFFKLRIKIKNCINLKQKIKEASAKNN